MRCLAIAQAWQDAGNQVTFAYCALPEGISDRLRREGMRLVSIHGPAGSEGDATETAEIASRMGALWIVADGYHFGSRYQESVKARGARLLFVDDNGHAEQYVADVVLNQNPHADESLYAAREPHTQLLLGTAYAVLRREFRKHERPLHAVPDVARRILIAMGGADPGNATAGVIDALREVTPEGATVRVLVGPANPRAAMLHERAQNCGANWLTVSASEEMPDLLAWASFAIIGAGSTLWETAFMGVPTVAIVLAPNQQKAAQLLELKGVVAAVHAEDLSDVKKSSGMLSRLLNDRGARSAMRAEGRRLVDGYGVCRVIDAMHAVARSEEGRKQ
jgi:UDP-2,4-diacetamido-2,4,6-trideoxy-beta-L-altropyranose hydrolase